jgi:DNA (cytosine-5)-methyltransferase 1
LTLLNNQHNMSGKVAKRLRKGLNPELSSHVIGAHNIDDVISRITKRVVAPQFLIIDLFCGAGGTSTGFEMAGDLALVIACVNHDYKAIKSHWLNHSHVAHFEEDMRKLDLKPLIRLVEYYKALYPGAYVILWASLECTNFSKAKGGQPRDADSRTLADHLDRYVIALRPDYVQIENVVEFMSWGPMRIKAKKQHIDRTDLYTIPCNGSFIYGWIPESSKNGQDWMRWRKNICSHGYQDEWRELNSANFGAYTSRNRLFGIFARSGLPIAWPAPTHSKKPSTLGMHGDLQKWKAVKEVLDFSDEGESIFTRSKPLSDKTLERIYAGLLKYVAKGDTSFISKYYSGKPAGKVDSVNQPSAAVTTFGNSSLVQTVGFTAQSVDQPAGTITTVDHHSLVKAAFIQQRNTGEPESKIVGIDGPARTLTATGGNQDLVQANFIVKYNSRGKDGSYNPPSTEDPAPVISTQNRLYLAQLQFLSHYYGSGGQHSSIESPAPTIPTKARTALIDTEFFIDKHYGKNAQNQSIDQPAGTIVTNDKHRLVECEPFIMPTNFDNKPVSIDNPAPTITANRKHHYLVNPSHGGHSTSTDQPCPVIVARQDKVPLYLVQTEAGHVAVPVYDGDSEIMIRIKQFMAIFGIVDIKMRMLRVLELLLIQGFPAGYKLEGNQADQKKFIGNSVVPIVVKRWTEILGSRLIETYKKKIA